jgi:ABC-2 type transport system ATP-binding protein
MAGPAISVEHVSKNFRLYHERNRYLKAALLRGRRARYEEFRALDDVSFDVPHGATVGIIGSNGSGKSTMLKCLTGIYRPDRGSISVDGSVAALLELGAGFHPELSGRENVFLNAAILGMSRAEVNRNFDSIVEFAGLERFIDTPVKNFSSGMTVRLGFSIATHVEPEILLIDEVLSVGDQAFQRKSSEKIEQFRRDGRTIVVVSHALSAILQLCREVIWLEKGTLRSYGPAADVVAEYTGQSYEQHTAEDSDHKQRWGTGAAIFTSVRILDRAGERTDRVGTNEPVTIECDVIPQERLDAPVVRIVLSDLAGTVLWASSSLAAERPIARMSEATTISVDIPSLPLLEGSYFLSVAITDATGTTEFDHCRNWCRLDVRQTRLFDEGVVAVPATWRIAGSERPRA